METYESHILTATLDPNGIISISWNPDLKEVAVEHLQHMQEAVRSLGEGKKMPLFFTTNPFLVVSNEAQAYATSEEGTRFTKAIVVLIEDLATKIDYNVFIKNNKPIVPTQAFSSKEEGIEWLKSFNNG